MDELIAIIDKFLAETKEQANTALAGMPPIDQLQGSQAVLSLMNTMAWVKDDVQRVSEKFKDVQAKLSAEIEKQAGAKIAAQIEAGELVLKTDSATAISLAEEKGRKEAEAEFQKEKVALENLSTRRDELVQAHGSAAAAVLEADILKVEDFAPVAAEFGRRVTALAEMGVKAEDEAKKEVFADLVTCGSFDEAGKAVFDKRLGTIKAMVGTTAATTPARPAPRAPLVPGATGEVAAEKKPAAAGGFVAAF